MIVFDILKWNRQRFIFSGLVWNYTPFNLNGAIPQFSIHHSKKNKLHKKNLKIRHTHIYGHLGIKGLYLQH